MTKSRIAIASAFIALTSISQASAEVATTTDPSTATDKKASTDISASGEGPLSAGATSAPRDADAGGEPCAETGDASRPAKATVEMMVQLRYQATDVTVVPGLDALVHRQFSNGAVASDTLRAIRDTARSGDGLRIHRAYLRLGANPIDKLRGEALLDFARFLNEEDKTQLIRTAFAEYTPIEQLSIEAGIVDIPFSLFELFDGFNEAKLELAEKGPTHELLHYMGFAGRDVGMVVEAHPLPERKALHLLGGVLSGGSIGGQTYRGPGMFSLRALSEAIPHVQVGAGVVYRPQTSDAWWEELRFRYQERDKGMAYGADIIVDANAFTLRGEWLMGDRTDNDVAVPLKERRGDARTFMSAWGMASARFALGGAYWTPAARLEWLDIDREHAETGSILHASIALSAEISQRVRLLGDVSRHFVQFGTRNWEFDRVRYDTDYTSGTLQFQLQM